jgi:mono/diheme cytochrome c family protein
MSNTDVKAKGGMKGERRKAKEGSALRVLAGRAASPRLIFAFCLLPFAFGLAGCRMDMQDQPRYEYYEPGDKKFFPDGASSRATVEGTVPRQAGQYRDREDYLYTGKAAGGGGASAAAAQAGAAAAALASVRATIPGAAPGAPATTATGEPDTFPIDIDKATLERGRQRFQIFCVACHGMTGEGDGMIVRRGFQKPPSFYDDRLQENRTPASHFFDVITNGWGAMPDYSAQIPAEDRWKIIAYLRALQLSRRLKLEELSPDEQNRVRTAAPPSAGEHGEGGTPLQSQRGGEQH